MSTWEIVACVAGYFSEPSGLLYGSEETPSGDTT